MLSNGDVVTLNNICKYEVIFTTLYNQEKYILIANQNNFFDSMFCKFNNTSKLKIVKDENIIKELLKLYNDSIVD